MSKLNDIKSFFCVFKWFVNAEISTYPNEFNMTVNKYPYMDDNIIFNYEKLHRVRIKIHELGN
jgi:hypothetical protein